MKFNCFLGTRATPKKDINLEMEAEAEVNDHSVGFHKFIIKSFLVYV